MSDVFGQNGLNQTAIYWSLPTNDGMGGKIFSDGVEVSVRWEDRQQIFIDAKGQEIISRAVVYVDKDMDIGGYLVLMDFDSLASDEVDNPLLISTAMPIRTFSKMPSFKATKFIRLAVL